MKLTILGCGDSAGVPALGNYWGKCDPAEAKNRRTRSSIAISSETMTLLVDTSPDLREQANRANLKKIDAVLYTHTHSDHIMGIDEIRTQNKRLGDITIPVYGTPQTLDDITRRFDYLFKQSHAVYPQVLNANLIPVEQLHKTMTIGDIDVIPFPQDHGTCTTLGFRFGPIAYSTDMRDLGEASLETLKGIETWIVDAAAYKMPNNPVHATLETVYRFNAIIRAPNVYLTHMPAGMDYQTLLRELPIGYLPAYDGLEIDL